MVSINVKNFLNEFVLDDSVKEESLHYTKFENIPSEILNSKFLRMRSFKNLAKKPTKDTIKKKDIVSSQEMDMNLKPKPF